MKADFLFASLNLNWIIQKNKCQKKAHFIDEACLKNRGIIYLNVETWLSFAPPLLRFLATRLQLTLFEKR